MKYLVLLTSLFMVSCSGGTYCYWVQPNGDVVEFECSGQAEVTEDGEDPVMSDGGEFTIPWQWYPWGRYDFDSGVGSDAGTEQDSGATNEDGGDTTDAGVGNDGGDSADGGTGDGSTEVDAGTGNDGGNSTDGDSGTGGDDVDAGGDAGGTGPVGGGDDDDDDDDDVDEGSGGNGDDDENACKCKVEIVNVTGVHPNSGKEKKFVCPFRACTGDCEGDPRPKGLLSVCKRLQ